MIFDETPVAAPAVFPGLECVFSAPAMLRLQPSTWAKENPDDWLRVRGAIASTLDVMRAKTAQTMGTDITLSLLFNAFTEDRIGKYIVDMETYGFDRLYADSGGLQMVTTNRTITPELKRDIYEVQKLADFGFCFDEIPLSIKDGVDPETAKHRSQTSSKLFRTEDFDACIEATARNIKDQTEAFAGSNTKAFYIMQGNSADDMYRWFEGGTKIMEPHNYAQIQGLAPADTCMGNGEMESVEMLSACHRVINDFRDLAGQHIHFLGVGSPSRLLPVIFLSQSGYLSKDMHVSFDSSTQSMSLIMGNVVLPDGTRVRRGPRETIGFMMAFYDDMAPVISEFCGEVTREDYLDHVTAHYKSIAGLINTAPPHLNNFMRAAITCMPLWQIGGFFARAMRDANDPGKHFSALGFLREVKDEADMAHWRRQFSRYIRSSRIDTRANNTLELWS